MMNGEEEKLLLYQTIGSYPSIKSMQRYASPVNARTRFVSTDDIGSGPTVEGPLISHSNDTPLWARDV
jgi:hypothetical protein